MESGNMARLSTHDETADPANATHGNRLRVAILFCVIPRYKQVLKMVTSLSNACVFYYCDNFCNFLLKFSIPVIVRPDSWES